jgi:hypothetical protein
MAMYGNAVCKKIFVNVRVIQDLTLIEFTKRYCYLDSNANIF